VGIVLRGRGRKRRRNNRDGGRSINVYNNASNQNIISRGVFRGPAPLSLDWGVGRGPLADVFAGGGRLWFWRPSSLALQGGFTRRTLLRDVLGLHKSSEIRWTDAGEG